VFIRNVRASSPKRSSIDAVIVAADPAGESGLSPSHLFTGKMLDPRVRKILIMIESGKRFSIRTLAFEFNLSPSHLWHLFKNQTGVAMGKWLSEKRLLIAAHLLANSYKSVKEIAHCVGYEHTSSFVRAFERRFGRAPARYRKQSDSTNC
jgi:AraC-like DNA-binding protein